MKILCCILFLILCTSCVSRTVTAPDSLSGTQKEVVKKDLIWFWEAEFRETP